VLPLLRPAVPQSWQMGGFLLHLPVTSPATEVSTSPKANSTS
jgi:hypothetical protein